MGKTMMFRKFVEQVENLLTDSKVNESTSVRQFLKLVILNRNNLE